MRTIIDHDPYLAANRDLPWQQQGRWPCAWLGCPATGEPPFVVAYRLRFALPHPATIRAHVSADERYELFLDGVAIGRGSEQGAPDCWFYESYDLPLPAGEHLLVARVWALSSRAGLAQMSVRPGFLFATEGEWIALLGSGVAAWEATPLAGYRFLDPSPAIWRGANICIDGQAFPWGFEHGAGQAWQPAEVLGPAIGRRSDWEFPPHHLLRPATLPPMLAKELTGGTVRYVADVPALETRALPVRLAEQRADGAVWQQLLQGQRALTVPPHTTLRVIVDLQQYHCAYHELITTGGAGSLVRIHWAEALFHDLNPFGGNKGHRDEIDDKYFLGIGDTFLPDGGAQRRFVPLWWQAGRYLELLVQTADQPLTIERLALRETRYPLEMESQFHASDPRLEAIMPLLVRGMQMNAHEVFTDCPYYEQLMYVGDARLEALITYIMTSDERLPRKALQIVDHSRLPSGLTQSRYPSRQVQIIAPYALWWVAMVYDYAFWRDDLVLVRSLMPGLRATLESFRRWRGSDGLLHGPEGWNMMDWVPEWQAGIPPAAISGASGLLNWHLAYTLALVGELEAQLGEPELAMRARREARELAARLEALFWNEQRGLFADDLAHEHFSEHTQCMALLSGLLDPERQAQVSAGLLDDPDLTRTTIYFSHYLFETYRLLGRCDALLERMGLWFALPERGLKTPVEAPEPCRSDCHAWAAHPLYHYVASILGIRPASLGFRQVAIRPQLAGLQSASGKIVHPQGSIEVEFWQTEGELHGRITLPAGLAGVLQLEEQEIAVEGELIF
jgi:alpha-L-rhamnosidase